MSETLTSKITLAFILVIELLIIIAFGVLVKYDVFSEDAVSKKVEEPRSKFDEDNPFFPPPSPERMSSEDFRSEGFDESFNMLYPMFMDIQVMVFVGFGFLMTFLKKYAWSAIGFSLLLSCLVIQLDILLEGLFHLTEPIINLSFKGIIGGDLAAATALISLGAVLGKLTPLQLLIMVMFETVFFAGNKFITNEFFKVRDVGGSMLIHEFGAYFGLSVSFVLGMRKGIDSEKNSLEISSYQNDVTSMLGTFFLWMFWPSFNGIEVPPMEKYRVLFNTYLALTASAMSAFAVSVGVSKNWKFNMIHIQNATLAGGVAIGSSCHLNIHPVGALVIGCVAGAVSVLGFSYIKNPLHKYLRIHDTCGVHYLHGIPGLIGGAVAGGMAFLANEKLYGASLRAVYPEITSHKDGRTAVMQAVYQFATLGASLGFGILGGLITGVFIVFLLPNIPLEERYNDDLWWENDELDE